MKKKYIKPTIQVIKQHYDEGLCQGMVVGSQGFNGGSEAKPGGEWETSSNNETWGGPMYDETWGDPTSW